MTETYREMLIEQQVPPADARLIQDIATHAVQEAAETLVRVIERLPDNRTRLLAMVVAYAMLASHAERVRQNWTILTDTLDGHL